MAGHILFVFKNTLVRRDRLTLRLLLGAAWMEPATVWQTVERGRHSRNPSKLAFVPHPCFHLLPGVLFFSIWHFLAKNVIFDRGLWLGRYSGAVLSRTICPVFCYVDFVCPSVPAVCWRCARHAFCSMCVESSCLHASCDQSIRQLVHEHLTIHGWIDWLPSGRILAKRT